MKYLKNNKEWQQHLLMAFLGGIYGTYALVLRGQFGSAVTGNFMEMMNETVYVFLLGSADDIPYILMRIGAGLVFGGALILSTMLQAHTKLPMKKVTLAAEAIGIILTVFIPENVEPLIALYPVFFISSFQWGTFYGVKEYGCATIFTTNNFRQCITAWAEYTVTHQEKDRRKGSFYGMTVLCFLLGGIAGAVCTVKAGPYGLLIGLIPLALAALLNT